MEREFKWIFNEEIDVNSVVDYVFTNPYVVSLIDGERRSKKMFSQYYDTYDFDLRNERITLRVRKENDIYVTTLKYGGGTKDGLHERNELNFESHDNKLNIDFFQECPLYEKLLELNKKGLREKFGAKFTRNFVILLHRETNTVMELALDLGYLFSFKNESNDKEKICEVELELLQGDENVFVKIGKDLMNVLKMQPFNKSKASRAAAL